MSTRLLHLPDNFAGSALAAVRDPDSLRRAVADGDLYTPDPAQSPIVFYFGLIAADEFFERCGRYPGCCADENVSVLDLLYLLLALFY